MARQPLDRARLAPAVASFRRSGLSVSRIASRLGVSQRTVTSIISDLGLARVAISPRRRVRALPVGAGLEVRHAA